MEKKQFVISADLGENGRLLLKTHEEVSEWVEAEIKFWGWLDRHNDNAVQQARQSITANLNNVRNINQECINHKASDQYDAKLSGLRRMIEQFSSPQNIILTKNPKAQFVEQLRSEIGQNEAGYCLAFFMGKGVVANNPQAIRGTVEAVLFEHGIKRSARPEKVALEKLRGKFEEDWNGYQERYHELDNSFQAIKDDIEATKTSNESEFSDAIAESVKAFEEARSEAQEEWKRIKETYLDHMALEAPVDYWGKEKTRHRSKGIIYAVASGLVAVAGGVGLFFLARWLLTGESGHWEGFEGVTLLGLPLWHVVIFSVFGSLFVWLLRVLVRLMMSEIHLMTDAGERVVMAMTYQALVKEGQGPAENDRTLILQTLFRPSTIGVLKDDGVPVMPADWVSKIVGK